MSMPAITASTTLAPNNSNHIPMNEQMMTNSASLSTQSTIQLHPDAPPQTDSSGQKSGPCCPLLTNLFNWVIYIFSFSLCDLFPKKAPQEQIDDLMQEFATQFPKYPQDLLAELTPCFNENINNFLSGAPGAPSINQIRNMLFGSLPRLEQMNDLLARLDEEGLRAKSSFETQLKLFVCGDLNALSLNQIEARIRSGQA